MTEPTPRHAYDLAVLPRPAGRIAPDADHGWVFGLPRGIATEQWPLDPMSGGPLLHGFSLLLPPDYRCHGPEIAGLAFFATAADQNDGGGLPIPALAAMILTPGDALPDPAWHAHWQQARTTHPRTHRMTDLLGYHYAVVLLTAEELAGAPAEPPALPVVKGPEPEWRSVGAAKAYCLYPFQFRAIGGEPEPGVAFERAIRWTPRAEDPNVGKEQGGDWSDHALPHGLVSPFTAAFELTPWAAAHAADHIGGTMRPVQSIPAMSPYYLGFEEYFGGYNFGTGNAQLDFKRMTFDWACG